MTFKEFNHLSKEEANKALGKCCVSKTWISKIVENLPFASENELILKAAKIWFEDCSIEDYKEAFTG
ncbi:MAG: 2-oxo-4-hydroxy-4-carboxy-5-ureidoimidazoline decarboxylase, partial [Aquaticitalea sp.]